MQPICVQVNKRMAVLDSYKFELSNLQLGDYHFDYVLDDAFFAALEVTDILGGSVHAHADLTIGEFGHELHLQAQGDIRITCDRCLDEMTQKVTAEETFCVKEGMGDDEDTIFVEGTLDIAWLLYEMITLDLPLVHSHQEGECNPEMEKLLQTHLCTDVEDTENE